MRLKLLKKSEIVVLKSQEKQREMDAGLKLAEKVDTLRETRATEEESLRLFREKTIAGIHEETKVLVQEKTVLEHEVAQLKEDRARALVPLDQAFAQIEENEKRLETVDTELKERAFLLAEREASHELQKKQILDEERRVVGEKKRADQLLAEADNWRTETKRVLTLEQIRYEEAEALKQKSQETLNASIAEAFARKEYLDKRAEALTQKEATLIEKEVLLIDREKTLEREFKRLKK